MEVYYEEDNIYNYAGTVVEPGELIEFGDTVTWEAFMDKAVYMKAHVIGESEDFAINPEGYEIQIKK